jgi:thiol-disulfide isomerase/thioredoxin
MRHLQVLALALAAAAIPAAAQAAQPSLATVLAASDWLNGKPDAASLRGKVVLVDVFTFGCYNCKNVTPNLKKLHADNADTLVVIGIHSPETPYEHARANVVEALKAQGIVWPVALDPDMKLWNAYGIEYWPTQLIFDKHGRLRKTVVGDSQDELVDDTVRALAAEN